MWLDVCGSILWRENEVYHLAVWPSSHVVRKTECAHHPAAPAEPLAFARLEDESVPLLLRNSVTFSHPNITAVHLILFQVYSIMKYALPPIVHKSYKKQSI